MGDLLDTNTMEANIQSKTAKLSFTDMYVEEKMEDNSFAVQMTLGELISALEFIPQKELLVKYDFTGFSPTRLDAWCGAIDELALGYATEGHSVSVSDFLALLKESLGKQVKACNGSSFEIDKDAPLWVANNGSIGQTAIMDVINNENEVVLVTGFCEH